MATEKPKVISVPRGWRADQALIDKLAGMNREQRRKWVKQQKNRKGR